MNLAIDIGNTRVKTGVFKCVAGQNYKLLNSISHDSFDLTDLKEIIKENPGIENVILCSVRKYPSEWKKELSKHLKVYELSSSLLPAYKLPIKLDYTTPETLGMDRIASVYGTYSSFHSKKKKNILVINAGTCITYDFLSKNGTYKGGAISPGIDLRFKALHTFTAQLPLVEFDMKFKKITGSSTRESILAGVQHGVVKEVEGVISTYQAKYPDLQVFLTGGSMNWLLKSLKIKINAEPFLTLKGLNVILLFIHNQL